MGVYVCVYIILVIQQTMGVYVCVCVYIYIYSLIDSILCPTDFILIYVYILYSRLWVCMCVCIYHTSNTADSGCVCMCVYIYHTSNTADSGCVCMCVCIYIVLLTQSCVAQTEMMYKKNPKLLTQIHYCEKEGVPYVVIVGENEMEKGGVTLRNVDTRQEVNYFIHACMHHR